MTAITWERLLPWILAISTGVAYALFCWGIDPPPTFKDLLAATLTISAIVIGFFATAKSLILTVQDKPALRTLKGLDGGDRNWIEELMTRSMDANYAAFLVAILSGLMLLFDFQTAAQVPPTWWDWMLDLAMPIWVAAVVAMLATALQVVRALSSLLRIAVSGDTP
ncbi:MAG: hypothetical protein AAGF84_03845 [Planctomycetota bacterium]